MARPYTGNPELTLRPFPSAGRGDREHPPLPAVGKRWAGQE